MERELAEVLRISIGTISNYEKSVYFPSLENRTHGGGLLVFPSAATVLRKRQINTHALTGTPAPPWA